MMLNEIRVRPATEHEWSAHPARQRPRAAALALTVIAAIGAAAWQSFGWPWAALSIAVLLVSLSRFFLRSRFALDAEGVTARYPLRTQRMRWSEVRRFGHDERGGYLSTRARRSRLDGFTGLHLIFDDPAQAQLAVARIRPRVILGDLPQQGDAG